MTPTALEAFYAIYLSESIGSKRLLMLCDYFGSPELALNSTAAQICNVPGFGKQIASDFISSRTAAIAKAKKYLNELPENIQIVTFYDPDYPEKLKQIYHPPALLFLAGNPSILAEQKNLAIIGSRKMTDYGKRVTREICKDFAKHSIVVTSGFASGVDTCAHEAIFEAGGKTIAVLGSGIDVIYPASNKGFAKKMINSGRGLIVSELPLGTPPEAQNFPWRNRIVSGLSTASIIIESEEKGGSMITASLALDQGKDIFALPGDVSRPMSRGPNQLIFDSRARLFRGADDILQVLNWAEQPGRISKNRNRTASTRADLSVNEKKIVAVLDESGTGLHIDEISERTGLATQIALVHLLELEFKDVVRQMAGKHFSTIF